MTSRTTTQSHVETVLRLKQEGQTHAQIVAATKLSPNTVSRIFGGWRPTGKKAVRLTRNVYRLGEKKR